MNTITAIHNDLQHVNVDSLPWVYWAMHGAYFKLMYADPTQNRFTLLIKVQAKIAAPMHRHLGAVEVFVLDGGFYYHDNPNTHFNKGTYLREDAGSIHKPISDDGAILLATFYGAVEGLDDQGNITGRVDCQWHVDVWNNAITQHNQTLAHAK